MDKAQKERVVAELAERLRTTETLIVADYRGLTMPQIDDLRTKLLEHGARFAVVKNTLTRRAAEAAGSETLLALLEGPTAIAFLESDGDPVPVAKALVDAARETRLLALRGYGGRVELSVIDNGPGVPRSRQGQLFEPFFTTEAKGTGLGLYLARELCAANRAQLEYVNDSTGAHFRIRCLEARAVA